MVLAIWLKLPRVSYRMLAMYLPIGSHLSFGMLALNILTNLLLNLWNLFLMKSTYLAKIQHFISREEYLKALSLKKMHIWKYHLISLFKIHLDLLINQMMLFLLHTKTKVSNFNSSFPNILCTALSMLSTTICCSSHKSHFQPQV